MAPTESMEERGSGARAPRQPIRKQITSSLDRQQNLSLIMVVEVDGRAFARELILLLPELSVFFSHLPLYKMENRLLMPLHPILLGTRIRRTPCFIISSASINLAQCKCINA